MDEDVSKVDDSKVDEDVRKVDEDDSKVDEDVRKVDEDVSKMDELKFKNLILSGGGILGIAHIGALEVLEPYLKGIQHFVGTSVGSLIATIFACGGTIGYLKEIFINSDLSRLEDSWSIFSVYRLYSQYGLCYGYELDKLIGKTLTDLMGSSDITFEELYQKKGVKLTIVGTNVTKKKRYLFSVDSDPKMQLRIALKISSNYPGIFIPVNYQNDLWIDGGVEDNFAIDLFKNDLTSTLGLSIISEETISHNHPSPIRGLHDYLNNLFWTIMNRPVSLDLLPHCSHETVKIYTGDFPSMNFNLTYDQKIQLYEDGKIAANNYLRSNL